MKFLVIAVLVTAVTAKSASPSQLKSLVDKLEELKEEKREENLVSRLLNLFSEKKDEESLKCNGTPCTKPNVCVATLRMHHPHCLHIYNPNGDTPDTKCAGRCGSRAKCKPHPGYDNAHMCVPDADFCSNCKSNDTCIDYGFGPLCVEPLEGASDDCGGLCEGEGDDCKRADKTSTLMNCHSNAKYCNRECSSPKQICIDYGYGPVCQNPLAGARDACGGLCAETFKCEKADPKYKLMKCHLPENE